MRHSGPVSLLRRSPRSVPINFESLHLSGFMLFCLCVLFVLTAPAQAPSAASKERAQHAPSALAIADRFAEPPGLLYQGVPADIPQDEGVAGLRLQLLRLGTAARLMQVVAHPDDEDGGLLTLQARGHGVTTLLMTLNRGEGGQNKVGSNLSDVLGVLRTEELLASDQHYGVQDRFSRVADFGFSKNPDETFAKWGGHDVALADMVRVIRTFRPDVLVARFSGTERDGHGNHQASGILTKEAFRAAADPKRFPDQIARGLEPWQPKKLYIGNVCPWGSMTCPDPDWSVKFNTGQRNAELGMSYVQFAMKGLRHQLSQGAANWTIDDGDRFTFYRRVDSVLPEQKAGHEQDFFDGIDTSWQALASRFDISEAKFPGFQSQLAEIAKLVADASKVAGGSDPSLAAQPLTKLVTQLTKLSGQINGSNLPPATKLDLLTRIAEKQQQAETALNLALGVTLTANVSSNKGLKAGFPKEDDALTTVSPGQEFMVGVTLHNGSKLPLTIDHIKLEVPAGWNTIDGKTRPETVAPGKDLHADFRLHVPKDTPYTRPYWHRDDPDTDSIHHVDNEEYATLPFSPPPLQARIEYSVGDAKEGRARNSIAVPVVTPFADEAGKQRSRPLAVVPAFSVALEPGTQVISTHNGKTTTVTVGVTSNLTHKVGGDLRLELPDGWRSEPAQAPVSLTHRGEKQEIEFKVFPAGLQQQGRATIRAVLESEGEKYSEGYTLVAREDLGSFYYYQPARQRVSIVDVQVPHDLKVGYIMGAGDDIPTMLKQVGMNVTMIPAEHLATEDLGKFGTIVLGIRAYDTQKDVITNNKKLLDFVEAGGTLVVQYNTTAGDFSGKFAPYPADLSRARVSVEDAPIDILAPEDPIFHYPNTITQDDFNGWVQERGLYFMSKWDDHFTPLLACHDPGEEPQKGGLLRAQYGKGTYIYTGYAFFRQLPAGVPGAMRLFVNILSAGKHQP
ncbi:MAG TPA: PIG-L family deacetylase [Candidatus Sulfotelmatobacter sp.]|nr:PIG-L family deacetylase [Candidatus Sulfotelmatobacter sp.]